MLKINVYKTNMKFTLEETLPFTENETLNYTFDQNGIVGNLELKKSSAASWSEILKTPLNHDCRFSKLRKEGTVFIKCYIHFNKNSIKTSLSQKLNTIERLYSNDYFSCQIRIVVSKDTIYNRISQHNKASYEARQLQKLKDRNNKTMYICHNSKPYQGGGFTPK